MKKGLSSVVGAVLLILLVLVIASIVFAWSRYTLKNSEEEGQKLQLCSEIEFVVDDFCYETISVDNIDTNQETQEKRIKFNGRNDVLDSELYGFLFFLDYGGTIISISTMPSSELEGGDAETLFTDVVENVDDIKEIKIVPKIQRQNKIVICETNYKIIGGGEIKQC